MLLILSCKQYQEFVIENNCSSYEIEISKKRPLKNSYDSKFYSIDFYNGFKNSLVKIYIGKSLVFENRLNSGESVNYADSYVINKYTSEDIKVEMNNQCIVFNLDPNYQFYELHILDSIKKIYLNMSHEPIIGE